MKLFQTYFKPIPQNIVETNLSNIPVDIEYEFHDDDRVEEYMSRQPSEVYERYKKLYYIPWKTDLWRYCILYENGGMYLDADGYLLQELGGEIFDHDSFFVYDPICKNIHNGFLYTYPKNPLLLRVIEFMVSTQRIPRPSRRLWEGRCKKPANTHWSLNELTRVVVESCSINLAQMHLGITIGNGVGRVHYPPELINKNIKDEFGKSVYFFRERDDSQKSYGINGEHIYQYKHDDYPY